MINRSARNTPERPAGIGAKKWASGLWRERRRRAFGGCRQVRSEVCRSTLQDGVWGAGQIMIRCSERCPLIGSTGQVDPDGVDACAAPLTSTQRAILKVLFARHDRWTLATQIMQGAYTTHHAKGSSVVRGQIKGIRMRLSTAGCPLEIESRKGSGYRLRVPCDVCIGHERSGVTPGLEAAER